MFYAGSISLHTCQLTRIQKLRSQHFVLYIYLRFRWRRKSWL